MPLCHAPRSVDASRSAAERRTLAAIHGCSWHASRGTHSTFTSSWASTEPPPPPASAVDERGPPTGVVSGAMSARMGGGSGASE